MVAASRARIARLGNMTSRVSIVTGARGPSTEVRTASSMATPTTSRVSRSESSQAAATTGTKAISPTVPYWCVRTSPTATRHSVTTQMAAKT